MILERTGSNLIKAVWRTNRLNAEQITQHNGLTIYAETRIDIQTLLNSICSYNLYTIRC